MAISDRFHKRHAFAFSFSQAGGGIGIFVFGPLFSYLIGVYGWRGAMLLTGACTFHLTCLGALVFPPRPPPVGLVPESDDRQSLSSFKEEMMREPVPDETEDLPPKVPLSRFGVCAWLLHLSAFLWLLATAIPYILLADYTRSRDLEEYAVY